MTATARQPRARAALLVGLTGYGFSMALMVRAGLGLDPWDVFHQGLAGRTGMTIGIASAVVGVARAAGLDPAAQPARHRHRGQRHRHRRHRRRRAGASCPTPIGTAGADRDDARRACVLNAFSTVLYIGAGLGPGPRDGLMTGLVARTGLSVRLVRTSIEATVLTVGWLLGGTVGVGTVVYAFGIGPLVQLFLRLTPQRLAVRDFGVNAP